MINSYDVWTKRLRPDELQHLRDVEAGLKAKKAEHAALKREFNRIATMARRRVDRPRRGPRATA